MAGMRGMPPTPQGSEEGADANARDEHDGPAPHWPAPHWAVAGGRPETVKLRRAQSAEASARDGGRRSALDLAQKRDRDEITVPLSQAGATEPGRGDGASGSARHPSRSRAWPQGPAP